MHTFKYLHHHSRTEPRIPNLYIPQGCHRVLLIQFIKRELLGDGIPSFSAQSLRFTCRTDGGSIHPPIRPPCLSQPFTHCSTMTGRPFISQYSAGPPC